MMELMKQKVFHKLYPLFLMLVLLSWTGSMRAQSPTVVSVQPAALRLGINERSSLVITINRARDLFAYDLQLSFDPNVIQLLDADPDAPGTQVQPAGLLDAGSGFTIVNKVDNKTGLLSYAMTLLAPADPVSGDGSLVELQVRPVSLGQSPLSLSVILASNDGLELPVETFDGTITVTDNMSTREPAPNATATSATNPVPTQLPTTITPASTTGPSQGGDPDGDDDRTLQPSPAGSGTGESPAVVSPSGIASQGSDNSIAIAANVGATFESAGGGHASTVGEGTAATLANASNQQLPEDNSARADSPSSKEMSTITAGQTSPNQQDGGFRWGMEYLPLIFTILALLIVLAVWVRRRMVGR